MAPSPNPGPAIAILISISSFIHPTTSSFDTNEFVKLTKQPHFVDKTDFLAKFFKSEDHMFLALPRGFGKTTTLQMIKAFSQAVPVPSSLEPKLRNDIEAYHLFNNFKIASEPDLRVIVSHLTRYPVLYLDLKVNITQNTTEDQIIKIFNEILQPAYQENSCILDKLIQESGFRDPDVEEYWKDRQNFVEAALNARIFNYDLIVDCLRKFTHIMNDFLIKKPILLVDNYDYVAMGELVSGGGLSSEVHNGYWGFYVMVNEAIRRAIPELQRVVFTGLSGRIPLNYSLNDDWPMQQVSFLSEHNKFTQYFGILESELTQLLNNYNCTEIEKQNVMDHYKGYYTPRKKSEPIYNPYSISKCLESKKPNQTIEVLNYWAKDEPYRFIDLALRKPSFRDKITQMLDQGPIKILCRREKSTFLNQLLFNPKWFNLLDDFLLHYFFELGYFTNGPEFNTYEVANAEVRQELKKRLELITPATGNDHSRDWKYQ